MDIFFNYLIIIYYIGEYAKCGIIRRISGAEQEYSLSKAKVEHDRAWSPNGWVTVTCSGLRPDLRFLRSQIPCRLYKSTAWVILVNFIHVNTVCAASRSILDLYFCLVLVSLDHRDTITADSYVPCIRRRHHSDVIFL